jgi:ABC-type sugar transport system substrate-binding protein
MDMDWVRFRRTGGRGRGAVVGLAVMAIFAALALAACGGSSSSSSASTEATEAAGNSGNTETAGDSGGGESIDGKKVTLVSVSDSNPWTAVFNKIIKDELSAAGADVTVVGSLEPAAQVQLLNQAVAENPSLIMLEALDSKAVAPAIAKAKAQGIGVLNIDGKADPSVADGPTRSFPTAARWDDPRAKTSSKASKPRARSRATSERSPVPRQCSSPRNG